MSLKISFYIQGGLDNLGIKNIMVRTTDETLSSIGRINRIKRIYGTSNDVILISNHINAGCSGSHCVTKYV